MSSTSLEFSYRGLINPWAAVAIGAIVLLIALAMLRSELRHNRKRHIARWLFLTRTLIIIFFSWILVQPVLFIRTEIPENGKLIILLDDSLSMLSTDSHERDLYWLDLAQQLDPASFAERSLAAQELAKLLHQRSNSISNIIARMRMHLDELDQGLPWGLPFDKTLEQAENELNPLKQVAPAHAAGIARIRENLAPDDKLKDHPYRKQLDILDQFMITTEKANAMIFQWRHEPKRTRDALADILAIAAELNARLAEAIAALEQLQAATDQRLLARLPPTVRERISRLAQASRIQRLSLLLNSTRVLDSLRKKHSIEVLRLSNLQPLLAQGRVEAIQASQMSTETDFYGQFQRVLNKHALDILSGIVLFTDGQQTARESPEVIDRIVRENVKLVLVGGGVCGRGI